MELAWQNLLKDRLRLTLSIASVALAVMLILLLGGFLSGMYLQISAYLDHTPGELVVAQDGVSNLMGISSLLPESAASYARTEGAGKVLPILSQFVILDLHGKKQPAYLVGYDPKAGGGPWQIAAGREPRDDKELVFDANLAQRHGISVGDMVEIMDRDFTVTGLSEGTNSWMTSFVFVRKTAAEKLYRTPGATSFLLVSPSARVPLDELRLRLTRLSGTEVSSKAEVIANDRSLFGKFFAAPVRLMVGIAFLVGTLVVGLVIYTATVERRREYGALKAIGARNRTLYKVVVTQALIAAVAGSILGTGLALGGASLVMLLRPQFLIVLEPEAVAQALSAGLLMALLSALVPARSMAVLAPAEVFRK